LNEEVKLELIKSVSITFDKQPYLVIRAYETGADFQLIIDAIKDADPEMVLTAIEFWQNFITQEAVVFKEDFIRKLFDQ